MIYCPKCGTANRQGSKFCNECGAPLPATGLRCPMCGAMNPAGNLYCDRCSARLIPAERVPPEEEKPERPSPPKGISLPSVPLGEEEWLSELRAEALDLTPEEETPGWPGELEAPGEPPTPEAAIPEWLVGLEAPAAPPNPEAQPPESAIPEWLVGLEAPAAPPTPEAPPPESAIPEWLVGLEAPAAPPTPEAAIPEWLVGLEAPAAPPAPEAPPPEVTIPEWLVGLEAPAAPSTPKAQPPESAIPEWLVGLEAPAAPPTPKAQPPESAIPEWLVGLEAPAAPPTPKAQPPESAIPEWLVGLEETVPEAPPPAEKPTPPLAGIPVPPSGEIPEWLRDVEFAPPIQEEPSAQPPPVAEVDVHAGMPSASTTVPPILVVGEEEILSTAPAEIPDWLKEAPAEAPPEYGGLVPAEIPEWLRPLQPREGVAVEEEPTETEGFLSGLRGLLPIGKGLDMPATAQPLLPRAPRPAAVARAELLQGLLSRPMITPPTAEIREAPRQSGWVLTRFLVGVILLAAILLPMLVRLPLFGPPTAPTAEALFAIVNQLPGNTPVLIAWEYGPAESDEMDRVAGPLIEHLLRREARLIVVSTRMEGPAAAEALLASRLVDPSERSRRIANLGYLPGQAAGVREALGNLGGRTEAMTGLPASQLEILADVHSIADVGMVVILAAQPDDLKTWLEQISVANPNVPVVAGVSARIELISTPYLAAGQLRGMVAGLTGGAVYERQLDTGWGREYEYYLTSLGMAQLAIAALTVIGALIFLVGGRKR
jgi:hypothetical protein